ncbi:MAG: dTDP-4-dehydrorhamnose reductase [Saprospiraceae bacterium]|nr:dTDP-4-dehydrorhamnose reductase [Saprospiraceae bacterium]
MRILVTGANGQIAQELKYFLLQYPIESLQFLFFNKEEWDISDFKQSNEILQKFKADVLINTAAYTKVDLAEEHEEICTLINAYAPENLARNCKIHNTKFIHFSSDYVFCGTNTSSPINESHPKSPKGVYSISKSLGEDLVLNQNKDSLIIRSSWIYSVFGSNFVKTMLKISKDNSILKIVNDQTGSPTYARDIARVIIKFINSPSLVNHSGIFHYANNGSVSWFDFAKEIFFQKNIQASCIPISTEEFNAKAPRPPYSVLDCEKIKKTLNITIPDWKISLNHCLNNMTNK